MIVISRILICPIWMVCCLADVVEVDALADRISPVQVFLRPRSFGNSIQ